MAIQFVGSQTATITSVVPTDTTVTFALTGGLASTPAAGDLVLVSYNNGQGGNRDVSASVKTSGYSLLASLMASDSFDANMAVFRKIMGSTPDSDVVVFGRTGTASVAIVHIAVFRGVDATTPIDVTTAIATGSDSSNTNLPAITPVTAGNVIALFGCTTHSALRTYTTASTSYVTGFLQSNGAGSSYSTLAGSGYITGRPASVSYDPAVWNTNLSSTLSSWTAVTVALRPAANGGSITGAAAGTLDLTGTASGVALITGTAAGTLDLTGAASGAALITSAAAGSLDLTGTASGAALVTGAAAGTLDLTGAASGVALISGAAAGSLPLTGVAAGVVVPVDGSITGTATGSLPLTGTASGAAHITGATAGSLPLTGAAAGVAIITGTAAGSLPLTGTASGAAHITGTAAGTLNFTGVASGAIRIVGAAAGTLDLIGAAAGALRVIGAAAGTLDLTGAATGIHASRSRIVRLGVDSETDVMLFSGAGTDVLVYTGGETGAVLSSGDGTDVLLLSGGETSVTLTQGV